MENEKFELQSVAKSVSMAGFSLKMLQRKTKEYGQNRRSKRKSQNGNKIPKQFRTLKEMGFMESPTFNSFEERWDSRNGIPNHKKDIFLLNQHMFCPPTFWVSQVLYICVPFSATWHPTSPSGKPRKPAARAPGSQCQLSCQLSMGCEEPWLGI